MKIRERILSRFRNPEYRRAYAGSHLGAAIALQMKALRLQRGWSQEELAQEAGLKQSQISAMEQTDFDSWTLRTLRKVAAAFELPILVKFTSWGELMDDACKMSPEDLERPLFEDDPAFFESDSSGAGRARSGGNAAVVDLRDYQERNASITSGPDVDEPEDKPLENQSYG